MAFRSTDVANEILRVAQEQGKTLTPLQLVKLAYIGHGWWLAHNDAPLIPEAVEAWRYGPVIPSIYRKSKGYGRDAITTYLPAVFPEPGEPLNEQARSFIRGLVKSYGNLDGIALSSLTHQPGTPWRNVYMPGVLHLAIPNDMIRDHYRQLWQERNTDGGR